MRCIETHTREKEARGGSPPHPRCSCALGGTSKRCRLEKSTCHHCPKTECASSICRRHGRGSPRERGPRGILHERQRSSWFAGPAQGHTPLCTRTNTRAHTRTTQAHTLGQEAIGAAVTWVSRLCNSRVSIKSEFQMRERSVTCWCECGSS